MESNTNTTTRTERVLVTGGSGFLGAHCIIQLLQAGYHVRTTVRSLQREPTVRTMLKTAGINPGNKLSFIEADLTSDTNWPEAVADCTYVLHVASPFPIALPKNEDDLIIPAREGALRVLRAARNANVKRVVLTSSFAAVGYGTHNPNGRTFTEEHWSDPDGPGMSAYLRSKTLAERAAWNFINTEGRTLELTVINPVGIFGPVLSADYAASIQLLQRLLDGNMPGCPRLSFGIIDVRDVADLHIRAMTNTAANNQRFIAVAGTSMTMQEIAITLKTHLGNDAKRVPTKILPDWILRIAAIFDPTAKQIVPQLGKVKNTTSQKAQNLLGWTPRSSHDAIIATAQSLIKLGLIKK